MHVILNEFGNRLKHNLGINLLKWLNKDSWRLSAWVLRTFQRFTWLQSNQNLGEGNWAALNSQAVSAVSLCSSELSDKIPGTEKEGPQAFHSRTSISLRAKTIPSAVTKERGPQNTPDILKFHKHLGVVLQPTLLWALGGPLISELCPSLIGNVLILVPG